MNNIALYLFTSFFFLFLSSVFFSFQYTDLAHIVLVLYLSVTGVMTLLGAIINGTFVNFNS